MCEGEGGSGYMHTHMHMHMHMHMHVHMHVHIHVHIHRRVGERRACCSGASQARSPPLCPATRRAAVAP